MQTLMQQYPEIKHGTVISAVDLIRDPYRAEGLDESAAIKFAEELVEKEGCVGGEIIIETNDGKARLLWDSDRR